MIFARDILESSSPFWGYAYSYPHKSAYRRLEPAVSLSEAWKRERSDSLFLYLHVPFCEYRCGFCNLFTLAGADSVLTIRYLRQVRAEARRVRNALANAHFARVAIGGGTPTFLTEGELVELLDIAAEMLGGSACDVPASCEASPSTLTQEKAKLLKSWGVSRISLGVQSFDEAESRRLGRPQWIKDVAQAIDFAREQSFPVLNLDLIYGIEGQTLSSWMRSVETAVAYRPEELYLYPLYVRPLTGLGRLPMAFDDNRLEHYRTARAALLAAGYLQKSLRMFCLPTRDQTEGPVYCCQTDGMVGLGCGARSYTTSLHYSTEFAVGRSGVRSILYDYLGREPQEFQAASHGYVLDCDDQRRRYVIQSLLQKEGLLRAPYRDRFGADVLTHLPQIRELSESGLADESPDRVCLTAVGLERSDAIGPWLYSPAVRQRMEAFTCL
jgi:oxygen-independent coproporphyrinogen III oxidase